MKYLSLPGSAGHHASTPDSAANSPTGDTELIALCMFDAFDPASQVSPFIGKWNGGTNKRQYMASYKTNGFAAFEWSTDGTGGTYAVSSTVDHTATLTADVKWWVRLTFDADPGTVTWYATTDDTDQLDPTAVTWGSAIGTDTSPAATSIFNSDTTAIAGGVNTFYFNGRLYRSVLLSGLGGSLAVDFNADDFTVGDSDTDTAVSSTGETWTINGANSEIIDDAPPAAGGSGNLLLLGVG